jgi:lipopolysaccharide/colanic/teichoic acid biosynthesis glycosyltransferase
MATSSVSFGDARRRQQAATRWAPRAPSRGLVNAGVYHHVLGEALFKDALVRERKRADRFDQPFAVVVLDQGRSPEARLCVPIVRAVAAVKRDIDVMGWIEQPGVLGLLLAETSGTGALTMMHRVSHAIAGQLGDGALAAPAIRLYAFGDHSTPEGAGMTSVDQLVETFAPRPGQRWRDAAKRGLDIFGSLVLLILFAPVLLAIFTIVKWTSPGPALFKQRRIGQRAEPFTMLKFRTMFADAGHAIHQDYVTWFITSSNRQHRTGNEVFKLTSDPRITPAGRFLRKTSLDELPQFWNVLRGEMSLVGPRPPLPFEVEQYQPWHRRRVLEAKPGVTGPWQVFGRSRTTFDEMVRLDLRYARTHSLWTDIKILAATPAAMISGKGAC